MATSESLSAFEAQDMVQRLRILSLGDVGSEGWMKQHGQMERLNIQAHYNVHNQNEEFITDAFITFDKV